MGNKNSTKPDQQPPPPPPLAAEEAAAAAEKLEISNVVCKIGIEPMLSPSFEILAEAEELEISNFTCEICIEPMLSPNIKFTNGGLCAHPFCAECITRYIQVQVEHNHHNAEIKCPGLNCNEVLDPQACRALLPPQLKMLDKVLLQVLKGAA